MLNDSLKVTGDVTVTITGPDGQVKDERLIKNLVVTAGKQFIASSMLKTAANTPLAMTHMGIGSGGVAASAGDTALSSQLGRVALGSSAAAGAVVTYTAIFQAGTGTGAVTEAGVFNAAVNGTLLCRTVFAVVNKGADDAMSITWAITVS